MKLEDGSRHFLVRIVALVITAVIVVFAPAPGVLLAVIVIGQGHCLLAYLYQAESGKLPPKKLAFLAFSLALLCLIGFFVSLSTFYFCVATFFLIHFSLDEVRFF